MRKRFITLFVALLVVSCLFVETSFAEEEEGFIKRMWRKLFKKPSVEEAPQIELEPEPEPEPEPKLKPEPEALPQPEAEPEAEVEVQPKPEVSPFVKMTEEELREHIKGMLKFWPQIPDFIPELTVTYDEEKDFVKVEYKIDDILTDIEELDKETLIMIYIRVNNERTRIQTERIQHQLALIKDAQASREADRVRQIIQGMPKPSQFPKPVQTPPQPPPTPPKIPTPPPAPPQQPRR